MKFFGDFGRWSTSDKGWPLKMVLLNRSSSVLLTLNKSSVLFYVCVGFSGAPCFFARQVLFGFCLRWLL